MTAELDSASLQAGSLLAAMLRGEMICAPSLPRWSTARRAPQRRSSSGSGQLRRSPLNGPRQAAVFQSNIPPAASIVLGQGSGAKSLGAPQCALQAMCPASHCNQQSADLLCSCDQAKLQTIELLHVRQVNGFVLFLLGTQQHNCSLQLGPVKVEAAKRQIFSLLLKRNPWEQNRRKRKPAGKAATPAEVSDDEAPPQRSRGSKRGSRAAKAAADSSDASDGGTDSSMLPPPKRGRGGKRARQAVKAAAAESWGESDGDSETPPPPKKRRGGKRAGRAAEAAEQSEESDGEEYNKARPPLGRGRGAKKGRKAVRSAAADSSEEEGGPPARKRGSRRKPAAPAAPSSDEDVSDVEEAAGQPAGRRGRKGPVQGAASDSEGAAEAEPAAKKSGDRKQKAAQAGSEVEAEALDHAEQAAHEQPEQSKRKRDGRKQAAPKAAAGSAGEAAADAAADAAAEAAVSTKGRRGRPKGSKNKPKPKPQPYEDAEPGENVTMEGGDSDAETPAQVIGQGDDLPASPALHCLRAQCMHLTLMCQQRWAALLAG